jgi:hypothetical protein
MRGQTSPFEKLIVSIVGATLGAIGTLASVKVVLSLEGKPKKSGKLVTVNVWPERGPALNAPVNVPDTTLLVKLPSGLNV